eukprot:GHVN01072363.1.p1 GENE.GHVN01072363.1~~GHVN01072363.1.p1  ORF type:complete len:1059 (-),score=100.82 GHVN01072363.1:2140-5316(-)
MQSGLYDVGGEIVKSRHEEDKKMPLDAREIGMLLNSTEKTLCKDAVQIGIVKVFEDAKRLILAMPRCDAMHRTRIANMTLKVLSDVLKHDDKRSAVFVDAVSAALILCHMLIVRLEAREGGSDEYLSQKKRLAKTLLDLCEEYGELFSNDGYNPVVDGIVQTVFVWAERPETIRNSDLRACSKRILCIAVKHHFYSEKVVSAAVKSFELFSHLAAFYAELIYMLDTAFAEPAFSEAFFCEFGEYSFSADGSAQKQAAELIKVLCELCPDAISRSLPLIIMQLESESHTIRSACIEAVHAALFHRKKEGAEHAEPMLLSMLEERLRDVTALVRAKAVGILTRLCQERLLSLAHRKELLPMLSERLRDKSSTVRRKAVSFFFVYLETHPFYLDGGEIPLSGLEEKLRMLSEYIERDAREDYEQTALARTQLAYYGDAIDFAKNMDEVVFMIRRLLLSDVKTEVLDACDFIVLAYVYRLEAATALLGEVFHLVWCQDGALNEDGSARRSIRANVVSSFVRIFVDEDEQKTAENLLSYVDGRTHAEIQAVGKIISLEMDTGSEIRRTVPVLWTIVRERTCSDRRRATVFAVLAMIVRNSNASIEENIDILFHFGFQHGSTFGEHICDVLLYLCSDGEKLPPENILFSKITTFILGAGFADMQVAERYVSVVYRLCSMPEKVSAEILRGLFFLSSEAGDSAQLVPFCLLLTVGSACALRQAQRLDEMEENIRREDRKDDAANEREHLLRTMHEIRDRGILYGTESFMPDIVRLALAHCRSAVPILQRLSVIALSRFMCSSATFCKENIGLVREIMSESADPAIKCALLISLCDIAMLYNKIVDENIFLLTDRLADSDASVRHAALLVVSRLVLNDFVKLRGRLASISLCLVDSDQRVQDTTIKLFHEIAKKKDAIYNCLVEVLSEISHAPFDAFQEIARFLFSFIQKETQAETLVEKICLRLKTGSADDQQRRFVFCLSLLPCSSERAARHITALVEKIPLEPDSISFVNEIAKKMARTAKTKEFADELCRVLDGLSFPLQTPKRPRRTSEENKEPPANVNKA